MIQKMLIADDNAVVYLNCLSGLFAELGSFDVDVATTPHETITKLQTKSYQLVLLDISFSSRGEEGIDLIPEIRRDAPDTDIVMMTSHAQGTVIGRCMQLGASDYITKDHLDDSDVVRRCLRAALDRCNAKRSNDDIGKKLARKVGATFASKSMQAIYAELAYIRNEPKMHVLITGETGVGKELIARAIARDDEDAPFFPVNSSCFSKDLLEGELFGHEKGSFTGAEKQKIGLFELANDGDLFFDEVATLSPEHQTKLLRVVQSGEFYRIGGTKLMKTTARVIAATNEDLNAMVRDGKFREDLLQRFQRYKIHIPPLRERKEDIPVIVEATIKRSGKPHIEVNPNVMNIFMSHSWPRNVRQLEDTVVSAIIKSNGETLTIGDLPKSLFETSTKQETKHSGLDIATDMKFEVAVEHFSAAYLRSAIDKLPRPVTLETLGDAVGMSKSALQRRLKDYRIDLFALRSPESAAKDASL